MRDYSEICRRGKARRATGYQPDSNGDGPFNMLVCGEQLRIIASQGGSWDHLSVSLPHRCPTWDEMVAVRRAFFRDDEWAMELHPPPLSKNISCHPFCLHLWRPQEIGIPLPPEWMVTTTTSGEND